VSGGPTDASCSKYDGVLLSLVYSTLSDKSVWTLHEFWGTRQSSAVEAHLWRQDMNLIVAGLQPHTATLTTGLQNRLVCEMG
jgi:hypothetical protein